MPLGMRYGLHQRHTVLEGDGLTKTGGSGSASFSIFAAMDRGDKAEIAE